MIFNYDYSIFSIAFGGIVSEDYSFGLKSGAMRSPRGPKDKYFCFTEPTQRWDSGKRNHDAGN
ncbi:Protein of unknown function [Pyronema omphalodes CBS 100304]|uniref:Uncharacterized protein n=1 Tax=Pyronema omphalodes (strain CBS 100304) TaxID=1076935 RepID=U4LPP5_PYROM|nr:Protein of unknown function [Pyronema omphalodes CBS 100304]